MQSQTFEEMQKMIEENITIMESEKFTLNTFLLLEGNELDNDKEGNMGKLIYESVLK